MPQLQHCLENTGMLRSGSHLPASMLKDIFQWDVRNWSKCLDFWAPLLMGLDSGSKRVLTIGERDGGISLWFSLLGYPVLCSDRGGPTHHAALIHKRHGVAHLITYADIDVFSIPFETDFFDIVACKSVIGGLKRVYRDTSTRTLETQSQAVQEIHRVLKPGGIFCGAENIKGSLPHGILRSWVKKGRIGWRHLSLGEVDQLFDPFEMVEQKPFGFLGTRSTWFGVDRVTAALDACLCRFLPGQWQYITFIRAMKRRQNE